MSPLPSEPEIFALSEQEARAQKMMEASCDALGLCYLLLDVIDLRSQPLDHAVDLSDLLLGVAQVVPMPACCDLQFLVLKIN